MEQTIGFGTMSKTDEMPIFRGGTLLTWLWRGGIALLSVLVLGLAWLVAFGNLYKAGSTLGYNLGLSGGLMMAVLLLYPLRKRFRFLNRLGAMRHWFRLHMFFGIGGPLLILFHSTFKIGSMNSRVALYSMLLVAASGIVGRSVYRHIHHGLYGRKMTLTEAEQELKTSTEDVRSVLSQVPNINERLKGFYDYAFADSKGIVYAWRFATLRWRGYFLARSIRHEANSVLKRTASENRRSQSEQQLLWIKAKNQINAYIDAVCKASQFAMWEKLFSLWHVVHVPFIYLLVISSIVHVFAVHMY